LASGSADKTVKIWDTTTGSLIRNLTGHSDMVWAVAFKGDGMLASGAKDKIVKLWQRC